MKVKDASELRGIEANRPPEPKKKTESTTSSATSDKVSNEVKAQVAAAADAARQQAGNDRSVRLEDLAREGVRLDLGAHRPETFHGADLVVVSPGVPLWLPPLRARREDIEPLARHFCATCAAARSTGTKAARSSSAKAIRKRSSASRNGPWQP